MPEFIIHLSADEELDCLHPLIIMNGTVMDCISVLFAQLVPTEASREYSIP